MLRDLGDPLGEQAPELFARTKLSRKDHRHGDAQCACQQVIAGFRAISAGLRSVARSVGAGAKDTEGYDPTKREGTNVDVAWDDGEGRWTYCEAKLSEQGFGTAKRDQRQEEKRVSIYQPALARYCPAALMEPKRVFANTAGEPGAGTG